MAKSPTLPTFAGHSPATAGRRPATTGILRSSLVAVQNLADSLGDAGDEEAALVLDRLACRTRSILMARGGPPPTADLIARSAVAAAEVAEALEALGDQEAAGEYSRAAGRLGAILRRRRSPVHGGRLVGSRGKKTGRKN